MSETKQESEKKRQTVKLLPNRRYPTYQLYAEATGKNVSVEGVLKIAILTTFSWLRSRFREFEIPEEIDTCLERDYKTFGFDQLSSFTINQGYKVEVVWLTEDKCWVLQLIEPDLGPEPGKEKQSRDPVPGRLFETNISYQIKGDKVNCGFKTIVSEPESTIERAEVFRYSLIRDFVENDSIILKQVWPICKEAVVLNSKKNIERFAAWLKDQSNSIPAIIAVETCSGVSTDNYSRFDLANIRPQINDRVSCLFHRLPLSRDSVDTLTLQSNNRVSQKNNYQDSIYSMSYDQNSSSKEKHYPIKMNDLAKKRFGYGIFFELPFEQINLFVKHTRIDCKDGNVLFIPAHYDKTTGILRRGITNESMSQDVFQEVSSLLLNYPREKVIEFPDILFIHAAKQKYLDLIIKNSINNEEIVTNQLSKIAQIQEDYNDRLQELKNQLCESEQRCLRRKEEIESIEKRHKESRDLAEQYCNKLDQEIKKSEEKIKRLIKCRITPAKYQDVTSWVAEKFTGRLVLNDRAVKELSNCKDTLMEISLVCDALQYLAFEYLDYKRGEIDKDELDNSSSTIYDRPFSVEPSGAKSMKQFPLEYNVDHVLVNGDKIKHELNSHLKIGNNNGNLLRIYFFYDKERKQIVVGSLPKHLSTSNYH